MNKYLRTIIVAPMITTSRKYPTIIEIKHDRKIGWIVVVQIRTIDKRRIIKVLGSLLQSEIEELKLVIKETFVDYLNSVWKHRNEHSNINKSVETYGHTSLHS